MPDTTLMMTFGAEGGCFGGDYTPLHHIALSENNRSCFICTELLYGAKAKQRQAVLIPKTPRDMFVNLPILLAAAAYKDEKLLAVLPPILRMTLRFDMDKYSDDKVEKWMSAIGHVPHPQVRIDVRCPHIARDPSFHRFLSEWCGPCTWLLPTDSMPDWDGSGSPWAW